MSDTFNILKNEIDHIISLVESKNFLTIILNNISAITNIQKHIFKKYPHILNIHCIVYFINLITKDILGNFFSLIIYF